MEQYIIKGGNPLVGEEACKNREILRNLMLSCGFTDYECEWWHYRLKNEPYPDTYFEFPVSAEYLRR